MTPEEVEILKLKARRAYDEIQIASREEREAKDALTALQNKLMGVRMARGIFERVLGDRDIPITEGSWIHETQEALRLACFGLEVETANAKLRELDCVDATQKATDIWSPLYSAANAAAAELKKQEEATP